MALGGLALVAQHEADFDLAFRLLDLLWEGLAAGRNA
jgi:hypothetical protein